LVSLVDGIFLVGFDDEIWHNVVGLKNETLISKRKKRKKESPFISGNNEPKRRKERPTESEE
jgi:hypothetical protein